MSTPLLEARGLSKHYPFPRTAGQWVRRAAPRVLRAVDDVDLTVESGRTVGVVGETGSGKSTLGRLLLRLERPTAGEVLIDGVSPEEAAPARAHQLRRDVQVVLQDPYTSLNPYLTIGSAIEEVLTVGGMTSHEERRARVAELLEQVGFPAVWSERKPGQLSGGGRQRVSIARALAAGPRLIVADEPVSALDVSVQAQVLNLFQRLQRELDLAYVFITHDLAVLERIADSVVVLYLGRVVETGPADALFAGPGHPYTQALLNAAPALGRSRSTSSAVTGELPDPASPPAGCTFHTRCPFVMDVCRTTRPALTPIAGGLHAACHLHAGSTPDPQAASRPQPVTPDPGTPATP
ncbi:oligopeptide/dipeptide ABC transporter ATP-binding protein [Nostocoides sp. Soil756]|uniref:ABC transporter ATP-binding protein n=1 Tax=Nostocoides sp. Soil756 TaxID=1736399 RepID=UPI0009E75BE1|nr:oligopeptide/dipeptide ABC transporter ATP-binding protein [Tetrasphaera sp. Soil756]